MDDQIINKPAFPLNLPDDHSESEPPAAKADAPDHAPQRGSDCSPRRTSDKAVFEGFAMEQGLGVRLYGRGSYFDAMLYDEAGGRFPVTIIPDCWTIRTFTSTIPDIWVVFRIGEELYLMPQDEMVTAGEADGFSWDSSGTCLQSRVSSSPHARWAPYRIDPEPGDFWLILAHRGWSLPERYRLWRKQRRVVQVNENDCADEAVESADWGESRDGRDPEQASWQLYHRSLSRVRTGPKTARSRRAG